MKPLWFLLLAGCNQIFGGNITGGDDVIGGDDAVDDGGITDDGAPSDGDHIVDDAGTTNAGCVWSTPSLIAQAGRDPSIAANASGTAYVVYALLEVNTAAFTSKPPGEAWLSPAILQSRSLGMLAVDGTGAIHLAIENWRDELEYMVRTPPGGWSQPMARFTYGNLAQAFAVGPGGPVVAHVDSTLRVGRPSTTAFELDPISPAINFWSAPAVAVASSGDLHVVALTTTFDQTALAIADTVQHAVLPNGSTTWQVTPVEEAAVGAEESSSFGSTPAIAVDNMQRAHLLYTAGETNQRRLVHRRGSSRFQPDTVAVDVVVAVFDAESTLHVVTHDLAANNLRYQRRTSTGAWTAPIALTAPNTGGKDVSLAVDGTGALHLAWSDPQQHLFYSACAPP